MARYGIDLYGSAVYGDPDPQIYNAQPFQAEERNYGVIDLTWRKPGGAWNALRLVRNYFGHPVESTDGTLLVDGDANVNSFFRDSTVEAGLWVYYSLFVFIVADGDWYRVGHLSVYSPNSYDGPSNLYDRVPRIYKGNFSTAQALTDPNNPPALLQYLTLMGFQHDILRNLANSVLDLDDPYAMSYDLVSYRMVEFGIPGGVQVIGPLQYKQYLNSAIYLWKTKGTAPCIQAIASIVMGVNANLGIGSNMLWTADLSDFLGGTGEWGAYTLNATVGWHQMHPSDFGGGITPAMRIITTANGDVAVGFVDPANPSALGLPVTAGNQLTAQAFVTGHDLTAAPAYLRLDFYNAAGTFLSSVSGATVPTRNALAVPVGVTATPPAGAVYAGLVIAVTGAVAAIEYHVTSVQVNIGTSVQGHQPGRDIQILLEDSTLSALQIAIRESRLRDILTRYLPFGATYTLVHGVLPAVTTVFSPDVILH